MGKQVRKIQQYQYKILDLLKPHIYTKIDDLAVDCLASPAEKHKNFMHAIEDLITSGRVESCGNSIRLNQ